MPAVKLLERGGHQRLDRYELVAELASGGMATVFLGRILGVGGFQRLVAIKRLQAYEKAGADVLMAPGLPDLTAVRAVCAALSRPFNFMVGIKGKSFTVAELEAAGVRRISLATSLYRMAMTGLVEAAREVKDKGTFGYLDRSLATPELNGFMRG